MEKKDYISQIENLTADQIAKGIGSGIVTFRELRETGEFDASKQAVVRAILKKMDDDAFIAAQSIQDFQNYLLKFPDGSNVKAAQEKLVRLRQYEELGERKFRERELMLTKIRENINEFGPDEVVDLLTKDDLVKLCNSLGINETFVRNYKQPLLKYNIIPESEDDIPVDYTDIFFWGIPSSGKTCALAAILSTIEKEYSMEAPDTNQQFGAAYRGDLIKIFSNEIGNLPGRTNEERTQYMPFLLYKRGENKKRKVSFFELSGEVFKYFWEIVNNNQIINNYDRGAIESSFRTLELLLKCSNQKIHYFFIDYNQETKHSEDGYGLTQKDYLGAAAVYFRNKNSIFSKRTDAVYVVVTKSDEMNADNKQQHAKEFLQQNFGSFMDVLKNQCRRNSVEFKVKIFSIGKVYFKRICKIDRTFANDIIKDILKRVRPSGGNLFTGLLNR